MDPKLNPAQLDAVTTASGPLLVLAGAGTGKTRVVTHRIAALIKGGISTERILAVTFTRKASGEMRERLGPLVPGHARPEVSTFHSLCVRILRRNAQPLGLPAGFAIYDRGDQESLAKGVLRDLKMDGVALRPGDLLAQIGQWKNRGIRPLAAEQMANDPREHISAAGYRRYQKCLRMMGAIDFDDLLLLTEDLFEGHPDIRAQEAGRFDHVLIDEYQDTNATQYKLVKCLAAGHRNLCVVGDDDQSIYGWRGAEVEHILRFKKDWPEAKVVRLEDNYRSTQQILDMANRLIRFNQVRHQKVLKASKKGGLPVRVLECENDEEEAKQITREISQKIYQEKVPPRDIAILYRTNEQPRAFETCFRKAKVPYVIVGGQSFFDRKETRDLLSYLKLFTNPKDDVALLRTLNMPPRGIGDSTRLALQAKANTDRVSVWQALNESSGALGISAAARASLDNFRALVDRYRAKFKEGPLGSVFAELISEIRYEDEVRSHYKDPNQFKARWTTVEELVEVVSNYGKQSGKPSVVHLLEELSLSDRDDFSDKKSKLEKPAVVLMTLHSSKGLEFPHVYLVGMEEGILPHHRSVTADFEGPAAGSSVEEERRLCYVGITRARETLTLSRAKGRLKRGKVVPTVPSRFLFEISGEAERAARPSAQSSAGKLALGASAAGASAAGTMPQRPPAKPAFGVAAKLPVQPALKPLPNQPGKFAKRPG